MKNKMRIKFASDFVSLILGETLEVQSDTAIVFNLAIQETNVEQPSVVSFLPIMQPKFKYLVFGNKSLARNYSPNMAS